MKFYELLFMPIELTPYLFNERFIDTTDAGVFYCPKT